MARRGAPLPWWFWAAGAAIVLASTGAVAALVLNKDQIRKLFRDAAEAAGADPDIADAIGKVESGWDTSAQNCTGSDLARGCAIGATQITWQTALDYGYSGTIEQLQASPQDQANLTAQILAAGRVGSSASKAAAWWNAGKTSLASAPSSTQTDYYPKLVSAQAYVQDNPVAA